MGSHALSNSMSYSWKTFKDKNDERQGREEDFTGHSRAGGVSNKQSDPRLEVCCASPLLDVVTHEYQLLISPLPLSSLVKSQEAVAESGVYVLLRLLSHV